MLVVAFRRGRGQWKLELETSRGSGLPGRLWKPRAFKAIIPLMPCSGALRLVSWGFFDLDPVADNGLY